MTIFWQRWLVAWALGVGLFGMVLALAGFEATATIPQALVNMMSSHGPVPLTEPLRFAFGLQGALTIGLAFLAHASMRAAAELGDRGRPIWRLAVGGLLVWYVIDSAISCANGFTLNAVSNTLLMIAFLVPIIASGVMGAGSELVGGKTARGG